MLLKSPLKSNSYRGNTIKLEEIIVWCATAPFSKTSKKMGLAAMVKGK